MLHTDRGRFTRRTGKMLGEAQRYELGTFTGSKNNQLKNHWKYLKFFLQPDNRPWTLHMWISNNFSFLCALNQKASHYCPGSWMAWKPKQDIAHYTAQHRPRKKPKQWGTIDIKLQKWKLLFQLFTGSQPENKWLMWKESKARVVKTSFHTIIVHGCALKYSY